MFSIGDSVRIRATHVHYVKGYQVKALAYKRIEGRVIAVNGQACKVDFTQRDHPLLPQGTKPGAAVAVNRTSRYHRADGYFNFAMLEFA
jgi:hypothetical protein